MDKLLGAWKYFNDRLAEPSTHSALVGLAALAGLNLDAGILHGTIVSIGVGFGMLGFFFKEAKPLS